jgi:membrane associated rhomboid family serine protease
MLLDIRPQTDPKKVPLVTSITFFIIIFFFLNVIGVPCETYLSLIAANTFRHLNVWNIITSSFLETNFISMVLSVCAFYVLGGHLELTWNSKQLAMFLFTVQLFAGLSTFIYHVIFYICFENEGYLYSSMHGTWGLITALMMGLVQLFPESAAPCLKQLKLRYIPAVFVVVSTFLRGVMMVELPFIYFSFFGSFLYLKRWRLGDHLGDGNNNMCPKIEFKFEDLFPPPLNILARFFGEFCHALQYTLCKSGRSSTSSYSGNNYLTVPATSHQVAERRRAKALELLDKKLSQMVGSSPTLTNSKTGTIQSQPVMV